MKVQHQMFEDDLRRKWKDRAAKAANGSRKESIHLHCISCAGGSAQEARKCSADYCFLWPYRPGAEK